MDAAQIVLAGATGVVGALSGAVGALYARLLKDYDREIEKNKRLEDENRKLQAEVFDRALKFGEDLKQSAHDFGAIAAVIERAQDGRYRR